MPRIPALLHFSEERQKARSSFSPAEPAKSGEIVTPTEFFPGPGYPSWFFVAPTSPSGLPRIRNCLENSLGSSISGEARGSAWLTRHPSDPTDRGNPHEYSGLAAERLKGHPPVLGFKNFWNLEMRVDR
ncbi:hypothetical protein KM043_010827 [Ampulex compressa]|nr:hypothetical protein KM043_010827 [Ampulex compressa]